MDLDEWELIPDDGFPKIHDDGGEKTISRTYVKNSSKSVFNNYLEIPSSESQKFVESTNVPRLSKQLVPLPDELQPNIHKTPDQELVQEVIIQADNVIRLAPNMITEKIKSPSALKVDQETGQDSVSQVFFKKMEENDFVIDMKLDSPKSSSRGIVPRIEANKFQFKEKTDNHQTIETIIEKEKEDDADGVSMWKWSLTGIGAICSFGVAAAICIIILGNGQQRKLQHNHQKLQFQFHADDKRIKETQTSRLNEAMSAARGIPLARAQITYGGYYEGF